MKMLRALVGFVVTVGGAVVLFLLLTTPGMDRIELKRAELNRLRSEADMLADRVRELQGASQKQLPPSLLLTGQSGAEVGLLLQQDLVDLAAAHGVSLTSFSVIPPIEPSMAMTSVVLEGRSALASFAQFLAALEQKRPRVAVSQMMLRATPYDGPLDEAGVVLRMAIWGFHAKNSG